MQIIYIGLAHTSQQNCAFIRETSQLMLYRKNHYLL